jgi:hypothetical protein
MKEEERERMELREGEEYTVRGRVREGPMGEERRSGGGTEGERGRAKEEGA